MSLFGLPRNFLPPNHSLRLGIAPHDTENRIEKLTSALGRFRDSPSALAGCFAGALFVQGTMVVFYFAVADALHLNVALSDLSVIVPISFVVQMLPVSVSGFGVREATFSFYFTRIGQPIEAALLMSPRCTSACEKRRIGCGAARAAERRRGSGTARASGRDRENPAG